MSEGDVPATWRSLKLSEVAEVRLGRQRSPKNHSGDLMRPYLRAANVTWQGLSLDDVKEMNFTESEMETFRLLPGDVLVNEASGSPREVGKAAIFRGEIANCAFQNTLLRVRPYDEMSTPFLHLYLTYLALTGAHLEDARGVGIAHLGRAKLASRAIPVPPPAEQEQIVAVLQEQLPRLDAALASIRTVRAKADQFRRSLLHAAFSGRLTVGPSATDALPPGWSLRELAELAAPERHAVAIGPFGSNLKVSDYQAEGVPLVFVRNIRANDFDLSPVYVTEAKSQELTAHQVRSGDVLVTKMGDPPGDVAVYPAGRGSAVITADCIKVTPAEELVTSAFLCHAVRSPGCAEQIREMTGGVAQQKINLRKFRRLLVPLPSPAEQRLIVEMLDDQYSRLDHVLDAADRAEALCVALRRSLLHAAFTGKLTDEWRKTHG